MKSVVAASAEAVLHLKSSAWAEANRRLLAKAIGEFYHERLLQPVSAAGDAASDAYRIESGDAAYCFRARRLMLDHLHVDASSIEYRAGGVVRTPSVMRFVVEFAERLQVNSEVLPSYLEELSATLFAYSFKLSRDGRSARDLADADFQRVEAAMLDGHPCFVANSGRVGFDVLDYHRYAPEAEAPVALVWLGVRRDRADWGCVPGLTYESLIEGTIAEDLHREFAERLQARGLEPREYLFLPVHPWQWENRVNQLFAADLASDAIVYLGVGQDAYAPQQSIRTLFNLSSPQKHYVKTALSIVNMGFTRGLSAAIAESAAAVNTWVADLVRGDVYLKDCGFDLLREVAWLGFRHRGYERAITRKVDPYREMLAALWRESPVSLLRPSERLMTMAALLYVDRDGSSLLLELVRRSRVGMDAWLRAYIAAYLKPQLHCFYAHRLVFTPHAENVILVLEEHLVTRTLIKDIAEDVAVLNSERDLGSSLRRICLRVPEEVMTLSIFTDVFDCLFRHLAAHLWEHARYPELKFWGLVAQCVREYEAEHPELAASFERYDLFAPSFARNCLNRLQLTNNQLMVDLNAEDPVKSLQFHGELANPIAGLSPRRGSLARGGDHAFV